MHVTTEKAPSQTHPLLSLLPVLGRRDNGVQILALVHPLCSLVMTIQQELQCLGDNNEQDSVWKV